MVPYTTSSHHLLVLHWKIEIHFAQIPALNSFPFNILNYILKNFPSPRIHISSTPHCIVWKSWLTLTQTKSNTLTLLMTMVMMREANPWKGGDWKDASTLYLGTGSSLSGEQKLHRVSLEFIRIHQQQSSVTARRGLLWVRGGIGEHSGFF